MERTERLLDLVALLLDAREPISWAALREAFPADYGAGTREANERKFERDKAELLELGIPLTYVQGDEDSQDGYVLARDAYYLPDAGFGREEVATLYAAGSAALASNAFPGRQDLAHALRKLSFLADDALAPPRVRLELGGGEAGSSVKLSEHLETLWQAVQARKFLQLEYGSPRHPQDLTSRRVDPYGLVLRRGIWSLVGYCHLRQALRTFHVHRIVGLHANTAKPRSPDFEVPDDFRLDAHVAHYPWQHRIHAPQKVTLELRGAVAARTDKLFPGARISPTERGAELELEVTFLDGLLRYALSLSPDCRVLAPEAAAARYGAMARDIAARHQGEAAP